MGRFGYPDMFKWKMMKKHWEVLPLVGIFSFAVVGVYGILGTCVALKRTDVQYNKKKLPLGQRVDLDWKPKLYNLEKNNYPKEIDDLRRELWNMK